MTCMGHYEIKAPIYVKHVEETQMYMYEEDARKRIDVFVLSF